MDINKEYLISYQFYNQQYHRLSIFGKFKNNILYIWILTLTSKKDKNNKYLDKFSRKEAKKLFKEYLSYREGDEHNEIQPKCFSIPATKENYKRSFITFCRENFLSKFDANFTLGDKIATVDIYYNSKTEPIVRTSTLKMRTQTEAQKKLLQEYKEKMSTIVSPDKEFDNFYNGKAQSSNSDLN